MNYAIKLAATVMVAVVLISCGGAEDRKAEYLQKGVELFDAGNYEKARLEFKNVLQIDPKDIEGRFRLAQTLEKLQQWRAAVGHYRAVVEQAPEHVAARIGLAKLYLVGNALDEAMKLADEVLALEPGNPDGLVIKAGVLAKQGDIEGSRKSTEAALANDPDHAQAISLMASLYLSEGKTDEAVAMLERGIKAHPGNAALRLGLANVYAKAGDLEKAGRVLEDMVALNPADLGSRVRLGAFFARSGKTDKAREVLTQAVKDFPDELAPKLALVEVVANAEGVPAGIGMMEGYVEQAPDDYELRLTLAKLYAGTGSRDQASAAYRTVIEKDGLGVSGLKARNALGRLALGAKDLDEARRLADEVLAENPKDTDALSLRGDLALLNRDAPSAIADYRAVLRGAPDNAAVLRALATAHRMNDEPDLAKEAMAKAVAAAPQDIRTRFTYAEMLVQEGDLEGARQQLEQVLELDPTHAEALEGLVKLHMSRNEPDLASQYVERYLKAYPDRPQGYYFAGLLHQAKGELDEGVASFEQSLLHGPDAIQPLTAVVKTYIVQQQYDKALERLDKAIAEKPDSPLPYNLRGEVLLLQKDYTQAAASFSKALELSPEMVTAHRNLALARFAQGDQEAAIAAFKAGVDATGSPLLQVGLAGLYEGMGRTDEAIAIYDKALESAPDSPAIANNLAMLLVTYREDAASLERAAQLVKVLADSDQAAYLDTLGWVSYKQGAYDDALASLMKAVEKAPESAEMNYHVGMAMLKTGDAAGARKHLEKALAKDVKFREVEQARETLAGLHEG